MAAMIDAPLGTLLIRADGGPDIGAGHLMRCLALTEAWRQRGGAVLIVTAPLPDGLARRVANAGAESLVVDRDADDGRSLAALAARRSVDWIVIDGYGFGPTYMAAVGETGRPILLIDDDARHEDYPVRALLNQNLHARAEGYAGKTTGRLLLGPRYALIRETLRDHQRWRRDYPETAAKVLLTFGGADPGGHGGMAIEALMRLHGSASLPDFSSRVVVGAANPRAGALRAQASDSPAIEILRDVQDMGAEIRWCDLAVSAAGSTVWELALFQTPMLLATASSVEEPVADSLAVAGAARVLGRLAGLGVDDIAGAISELLTDMAARRDLGAAAGALVDGDGADRVVEQMAALSIGPG